MTSNNFLGKNNTKQNNTPPKKSNKTPKQTNKTHRSKVYETLKNTGERGGGLYCSCSVWWHLLFCIHSAYITENGTLSYAAT